jgi:hypothetical protein
LLNAGMTRALAVDASPAYLAAAREEAGRRGLTQIIQFVRDDFVAASPTIPGGDVVTLDRVICCYPAYEPLLESALAHAGRCIAISYPKDRWYVRIVTALENGRRWLASNSFRTFVHPAEALERMIRQEGFELASRKRTWIWCVDVYVRRPGQARP